MTQWFLPALAWAGVIQATLHFGSSSVYALTQSIQPVFYLDFVSIGLLVLSVIGLSRWNWGPGPLCGAWGFEACLYSRAVLQRVGSLVDGAIPSHDQLLLEIYVLSAWLGLVVVAFTYTVYLCIRSTRYPSAHQ